MKKILLLNTLHVILDGLFDSIPLLLSFMTIAFAAGEKEAGVIIALASLVSTLAGLLTNFFSDHFGLVHSLSLIILIFGISFVSNTFSQNIYYAGFFFIIGNFGLMIFHNLSFSYLTANNDRRTLGKIMGDFTATGDIGRISLASLAGFIAALNPGGFPGWRIVCLTYGLGATLFAGYLWLTTANEAKEAEPDKSPDIKQKLLPSFSLLKNHQYTLPLSASVLDAIGSDQIFVFLPFLLFAKGIDPKIIGAFALAFTIGCFAGKTGLGRMADRFGSRKVFIISEIILAILLVVLILSRQLPIIIGASLLLGIVTKGTVPAVQTIITEPVRQKHEYNDIFSINSFNRGVAHVLSPLLFGFIASVADIHWSFAVMSLAAAGAAIPVLLMADN